MDIHPAAAIFPLMTDAEYEGLRDDISEHGLRDPIVLFEGKILDGRNRLRACEELGLEPRFEEWRNGEDPHLYVVSKNLHRRHLTEGQRAMVAAKIASLAVGRPKENAPIGAIPTQQEAADMLNVSRRSVQRAKKVLDHATPQDQQAVEQGEVRLSSVADKIENPRNAYNRIKVPEGETIESLARKSLALEESEGLNAEEAAVKCGLSKQTNRCVRDMVLLLDHPNTTRSETRQVREALDRVNKERFVTQYYDPIKPIVDRVFGLKKARQGGSERRVEEFERAFGVLTQATLSAYRIKIPALPEERLLKVIEDVKSSEKAIKAFRSRLEELL